VQLQPTYDLIITGGGLAGLTLGVQVKKALPVARILILEKRKESAPLATHKVGESTVELGAFYYRDIIDLREHLENEQLPKLGLRYFFSPQHKDDLARRVEVGTVITQAIPAHQLDRGLLENELVKKASRAGIDVQMGAVAKSVQLSEKNHTLIFEKDGAGYTATCKWIADATGRSSFLKRKLELEKKSEHHINAAWFRITKDIDINDWSKNSDWQYALSYGRRRLATNHLMGKGYWFWIIPLSSGHTSFGIVADPSVHSFEEFNTFEKAMNWLHSHEPAAAQALEKDQNLLADFKVMKNFAYDTKQFYSSDRWGLVGEAGAFMDPFYSPGSDFIALGNTWLSDLIVRDLSGDDIRLRSMIYDHAHKELLNGWFLLYTHMYPLFGKTQVMLLKLVWDWGSYWSVPTVLFMNNGYISLDVLRKYSTSIGPRFAALNKQMQNLFLEWGKVEHDELSDKLINLFDVDCLHIFHKELDCRYPETELVAKISANMKVLEDLAAGIFRRVFALIRETPYDMPVNPYTMSLSDSRKSLLAKSLETGALPVVDSIDMDIDRVWLSAEKIARSNER
jgi:flavin-dependent dehydrogenase